MEAAEISNEQLKSQRWIGAFLLLISCVLGYSSVFLPLQSAANHVASLTLRITAVGATPMVFLYGLIELLFPRFVIAHLGGYRSRLPKTKVGWAFFVTSIAAAFIFSFLVKAHLRNLGYSV